MGTTDAITEGHSSVILIWSATETFTLKIVDTLSNGILLDHVVSKSGQGTGTLLTSPFYAHGTGLLGTVGQEHGADVLLYQEVIVDTASHVREPHVKSSLTCCNVLKLGTQSQFKDSNLLS